MVPPASHRVSRVRRYSGADWLTSVFAYTTFTFCGWPSHTILLTVVNTVCQSTTPKKLLPLVWPLSISLATTLEISVDFFSSGYLDVSVPRVPRVRLFYSPHAARLFTVRVSPFGNPRIDGYLHLPAAYRSLSRPSSALDA